MTTTTTSHPTQEASPDHAWDLRQRDVEGHGTDLIGDVVTVRDGRVA